MFAQTRTSKKTSKLRVTGLCAVNSPETGEFPAQMASNAENVSIWWSHHACSLPLFNRHSQLPRSFGTIMSTRAATPWHIICQTSNVNMLTLLDSLLQKNIFNNKGTLIFYVSCSRTDYNVWTMLFFSQLWIFIIKIESPKRDWQTLFAPPQNNVAYVSSKIMPC